MEGDRIKELADALNQAVGLKATQQAAVERVCSILQARTCVLFARQPGTDSYIVAACVSPYENVLKDYISTGDGLLEWVSQQRATTLVTDAKKQIAQNGSTIGNDIVSNERSLLLVPLRTQDQVTAILYVGDGDPDRFTLQDKNLCEVLSQQMALSLEKADLFVKMKEMAITDCVTSLYTHDYFHERLIEEVNCSGRVRRPLSLIIAEADHFNEFNDTLGHPQGDALLREIARLLRDVCRDSDLEFRYGDDAFAVILKEMDNEGARKIAERIREAFELRLGHYRVKVTSSIGVACFPQNAFTEADLVKAADDALNDARHSGGNTVRVAQSLPNPLR
ncbi:MAG: sensor domain-containing diguanylate cyclase [Candidatus Xenobia bacterium]